MKQRRIKYQEQKKGEIKVELNNIQNGLYIYIFFFKVIYIFYWNYFSFHAVSKSRGSPIDNQKNNNLFAISTINKIGIPYTIIFHYIWGNGMSKMQKMFEKEEKINNAPAKTAID